LLKLKIGGVDSLGHKEFGQKMSIALD